MLESSRLWLGAESGNGRGKWGVAMTQMRNWVVVWLGILVIAPSLFAQDPVPRRDVQLSRRQLLVRKGAQPAETVAAPVQPSAPLTLDQLPAARPQVSYQNGSLSITSENSTLGDILREVHRVTGASIDVPASANERVVARLGPAPPRDVLASLLNGSSFNYVMVGSATDPDALSTVMLTAKTGGGAVTPPQTTAEVYQPPPVRTGLIPPPVAVASADDKEEDDSEDADDSADQDQAAGAQQQVVQPDPNAAAQQSDPNAGPKSPQQIMEMLRQTMQQQKKQAENPGDPPPQQ